MEVKKNNNIHWIILIITIVIFSIFCISSVFLIFLLSDKKEKNIEKDVNLQKSVDDKIYINGLNNPPVSRKFFQDISKKKRVISTNNGYLPVFGGIGTDKEAYSFSKLQQLNWRIDYQNYQEFVMYSDNKGISSGLLFLENQAGESCYEIVKYIFRKKKWEGKDEGISNNNGNSWQRVTYIVDNGSENELHGIDQCLDIDEHMVLYFIVANKENWENEKENLQNISKDIYFSLEPLVY